MKHFNSYLLMLTVALLSTTTLSAQKEIPDSNEVMFDQTTGSFTRVYTVDSVAKVKLDETRINPRFDDVSWRKVVMRVIDLREQQNRPLYYPHEDLEPESQKNLFSIILSNYLDGSLKAYISPDLNDPTKLTRFVEKYEYKPEDFYNLLWGNTDNYDEGFDDGYGDEYADEYGQEETVEGELPTDYNKIPTEYPQRLETIFQIVNALTPGVIKYQIQEIWYFNNTASTFENKIIAIAPIIDDSYFNAQGEDFLGKVKGPLFWIPFETLRPYLQAEYVKTTGRNLAPLTNFDDFFISRQFYSYIIKDFDHENKPIYYNIEDNPDEIRKEQQKVEDEILNFEQDLWNY